MGQYYKFVNATKQQESDISLPFNFGLHWAKSLENCTEEELKEMFDFVIVNNDSWEDGDDVIAIGDYGNIIYRPRKH